MIFQARLKKFFSLSSQEDTLSSISYYISKLRLCKNVIESRSRKKSPLTPFLFDTFREYRSTFFSSKTKRERVVGYTGLDILILFFDNPGYYPNVKKDSKVDYYYH